MATYTKRIKTRIRMYTGRYIVFGIVIIMAVIVSALGSSLNITNRQSSPHNNLPNWVVESTEISKFPESESIYIDTKTKYPTRNRFWIGVGIRALCF